MLLLLCDLGNTAIKFGISHGNGLETSLCLEAGIAVGSNDFFLAIGGWLAQAGYAAADFDACVASSVVVHAEIALTRAIEAFFGLPVLFAQRDLPVPLINCYGNPSQLGADRITGAFAATRLMNDMRSVIVIDYGTALTFDCVQGETYLGGLIFPGLVVAQKALCAAAEGLALIGDLDFTETEFMPGLDTASCMRQGLLHGYASVTEGLCGRLRAGLQEPVGIVATGGYAGIISPVVAEDVRVVPGLVMLGLEKLYIEKIALESQEE